MPQPYFEKYAEAIGDRSIIEGYEAYTAGKWQEYKDIQRRQEVRRILKASDHGVTYSHDSLFYETLHD